MPDSTQFDYYVCHACHKKDKANKRTISDPFPCRKILHKQMVSKQEMCRCVFGYNDAKWRLDPMNIFS